jgi:hypothetical protein
MQVILFRNLNLRVTLPTHDPAYISGAIAIVSHSHRHILTIALQSRTQSMPVRRLGAGHAQHLTCERAYSCPAPNLRTGILWVRDNLVPRVCLFAGYVVA